MPSTSGYPGVRKHGKNWQAKDSNGVYGTFADPYEAACALATALGKPPPTRRPNAAEFGRTAQQHIAALTTVLLAVPTNQLMSVLANAMLAVEQERAQRAQQPASEQQPPTDTKPAVDAAAPPSQASVLLSPLSANELRRAKRVKAIADWWRTLWATGETFHLTIERPQLIHCFNAAEKKRLNGQTAEYDAMDGSTFIKLLKQTINKLDGEVQRRPEGGGSPAVWWEIDAATYCPEELMETWQTQRTQAQQPRQLGEEVALAEQKVRDDEDRARTEEEDKLRTAKNEQHMQLRYEEQSRRMQLIMIETSDEEEEEWGSDDEQEYDD